MELYVERVFCDCMDAPVPCWIMLEKSPDFPEGKDFSGKWGPFEIRPVPDKVQRIVMKEGARLVEPMAQQDRVRVSAITTYQIPAVVRWMATDTILGIAMKKASEAASKSWDKVIATWGATGWDERMRMEAHFYNVLDESIAAHFAALA